MSSKTSRAKSVDWEIYTELLRDRNRLARENEDLKYRIANLVGAEEYAERLRKECARLKEMYADLRRINAIDQQRAITRAEANAWFTGGKTTQ